MLVRGLVAGLTLAVSAGAAPPEPVALTCVNPASGAAWQITIDYGAGTVDANPASIDEREIAWRSRADGSHYTLDRRSGALTVIVASSTGGWLLHDHCAPARPG